MNKTPHIHRNSSSFVRYYGNAMSLLAEALPSNKGLCLFDYPFNELVVRELCPCPARCFSITVPRSGRC